jgi:hypothetical protein
MIQRLDHDYCKDTDTEQRFKSLDVPSAFEKCPHQMSVCVTSHTYDNMHADPVVSTVSTGTEECF